MRFVFLLMLSNIAFFAVFLSSHASAQDTTNPVVVELFTSQSCSSCPPADKILNELVARPNVIALGCHVTYWNHLSWKDTLSLPDCTQLQNDFNAQRGSKRVYTPQMVINGEDEFVGSNQSKAQSAVEKESPVVLLNPSIDDSDIIITMPDDLKKLGASTTLYLYGYNKKYTQDIRSGENRGLVQNYAHPVTFIQRKDDWNSGNENTIKINIPSTSSESYAVILRQRHAGKILAAGTIEKGN